MRNVPPKATGANRLLKILNGLESDVAEHVAFLRAFLRQPGSVGALSPSSKTLARAMIEGCALERADTVVELGPGTGAFTRLIHERIGRRTTFVALELDPHHVRALKRRFPGVNVYQDSAERLVERLATCRKADADYIISGLPWANLPPAAQARIMEAIVGALAPDGVFTTFAYFHARWLPKARRFRKMLRSRFERVEMSPVIWQNLPPAFVYRCSRPIKPLALRARHHPLPDTPRRAQP